jgi:hypothetical protein
MALRRFKVDRRGYIHDPRTGEFTGYLWSAGYGTAGKHPRRRHSKFWFASILAPWARRKYTPGVSVKTVRRRRAAR